MIKTSIPMCAGDMSGRCSHEDDLAYRIHVHTRFPVSSWRQGHLQHLRISALTSSLAVVAGDWDKQRDEGEVIEDQLSEKGKDNGGVQ